MQRERERARGWTREGRETREKSGSLKERVDGKPWHVGKKHTCQLVPRGCLWKGSRDSVALKHMLVDIHRASQYGLSSYLDSPSCVYVYLFLSFSVSHMPGKEIVRFELKILLRKEKNQVWVHVELGGTHSFSTLTYQMLPVSSWDRS